LYSSPHVTGVVKIEGDETCGGCCARDGDERVNSGCGVANLMRRPGPRRTDNIKMDIK